ncbi:MAG: dihydrodipicolinate synthase family protein [Candidatus Limnocylindria bacterium]
MRPDELSGRLRGALAFPITPFDSALRIDETGFRWNIERLAASPVAALVVAGGTGEFHALDPGEIHTLSRIAVETSAGRKPVIVGVGGNATTASLLARRCEAAGADGLLLMPPSYGRAEDDGLFAYYEAIASSVGIGVFPYARDNALLSPALVARLARIPNVVAFKDGQGDLRLWKRIRERVGADLRWLAGVGDDLAPQYFSAGAEGFTSSIANLYPAVAVRLFALATTDVTGADAFVARHIQPIYSLRSKRRGYEVTTIKAAMARLGLPAGPVRPPLVPLAPEDTDDLDIAIAALGAADGARAIGTDLAPAQQR